MSHRISEISAFLLQLDAIKSVKRRTYINGGERVENSAEHSWHLAMACWVFSELLDDEFEVLKLIQMTLLREFIKIENPEILRWFIGKVEEAVQCGCLAED